jgi:DNA ligase-associated metallophosphoesterase
MGEIAAEDRVDRVVFDAQGETLHLLAARAVLWESRSALIVSDLHFGKSAHFRKNGIGVPQGADAHTAERLAQLLDRYAPQTLYLLGDLFHSHYNAGWETVSRLRAVYPAIDWVLVEGNHDVLPAAHYTEAGIQPISGSLDLGPISLQHEPADTPGNATSYTLCGHLHPAVRLRGAARQRLRVDCFWVGAHQLVLPAFGSFTGGQLIAPGRGDRIFAVVGDSIVDVGS